jgi:hypothetical protein
MSPDAYFAHWGRDRLRRWPADFVAGLAIPEASKRFLTDLGLPSLQEGTLRFDHAETESLPRLPGHPACRILGYDTTVPMCLDESTGGQVVSAEDVVAGVFRFVNTSVEALGESLTLFDQYQDRVATLAEADVLDDIERVAAAMRVLDARAFADADHFWPLVIAQMREGSL